MRGSNFGGKLSAIKGEVGQRGALVCERYLDDMKERGGSKLKFMCRAKCLPLLDRICVELGIDRNNAICVMCDCAEVESLEHVFLRCSAYEKERGKLEKDASLMHAGRREDAVYAGRAHAHKGRRRSGGFCRETVF